MTLQLSRHPWIDPIRVFRAAKDLPGRALLDSGGPVAPPGRWTVLAVCPTETMEIRVGEGLAGSRSAGDPFESLARLHGRWLRQLDADDPKGGRALSGEFSGGTGAEERPPFTGGVIAAIGYDSGRAIERLPSLAEDDPRLPDLWAAVYDGAVLFDRLRRRVIAVARGAESRERLSLLEQILHRSRGAAGETEERCLPVEAGVDSSDLSATEASTEDGGVMDEREDSWQAGGEGVARASAGVGPGGSVPADPRAARSGMRPAIPSARSASSQHGASARPGGPARVGATEASSEALAGGRPSGQPAPGAGASREWFLRCVETIRAEIARGEVYQANLTRRVTRAVGEGRAQAVYERLRRASPTPFGAFLDGGAFQLLSASPELFLRIAGRSIETRPIKGTRPRGRGPVEDSRLKEQLLGSVKDRAELLMIVDLERNDLGKICEIGSIVVDPFPVLEGYSSVWHLHAAVRGRLRPGVGASEALRAAFPGGSITGAPKIRAMEILEGLEPARRKFSMGSLAAWDFGGDLHSSILIRTLVIRGGLAVFHVGCGIVADSVPEEEYQESVAKESPLLRALEGD